MIARTLTRDEVLAVHRMLQVGARHVEIARELDLAVSTIGKIAREWKLRGGEDPDDGEFDLPEDDPPPDYDAHNLRRCPVCGAMVYLWPCLACHMQAQGGRVHLPPPRTKPQCRRKARRTRITPLMVTHADPASRS